jgi:hypothetical protein
MGRLSRTRGAGRWGGKTGDEGIGTTAELPLWVGIKVCKSVWKSMCGACVHTGAHDAYRRVQYGGKDIRCAMAAAVQSPRSRLGRAR